MRTDESSRVLADASDTNPPCSSSLRIGLWIALALLLGLFVLAAYSEARVLPGVDDSDEAVYLDEACWIHEHGGASGFLKQCFSGTYPYTTNHPLVQWGASYWAQRSLSAVGPMRTSKVLLAVAATVLFSLVCMRLMPLPAALFMTALLLVSRNWYMKSRLLCPEPVIYAAFFIAWVLISGWLRPRGRWFWAGVATGVSFLLKGTAMLLLFALPFAVAAQAVVIMCRHKPLWTRPILRGFAIACGLFLCGFLLTASPLLARNAVRFGNPLYNQNSELMWADDYSAHLFTQEQRAAKPLTIGRYLKTHSPAEMAKRLVTGLAHTTPRFLGALTVDRSFGMPIFGGGIALSALLCILGIVGTVRLRGDWRATYTIVLLALGLALFSWYHIVSYASRFVALLTPIAVAMAFDAAGPVVPLLRRWGRAACAVALLFTLSVCVLLAMRIRPGVIVDGPPAEIPCTLEYRFLMDWYRNNVSEAGEVCFQTPHLAPRYAFNWMLIGAGNGTIVDVPPFADFESLERYMVSRHARYLVIERDSLRDCEGLLGGFFKRDAAGGLHVARLPPGWMVKAQDPWPPVDFIILERAEAGASR